MVRRPGVNPAVVLGITYSLLAAFLWAGVFDSALSRSIPVKVVITALISGIAALAWLVSRKPRGGSVHQPALDAELSRYRALFENSPISQWEGDLSAVRTYTLELAQKANGDLSAYLDEHPEAVREGLSQIRVLDANQVAVQMHKVHDKKELLGPIRMNFLEENRPVHKAELIAIAEGRTHFESENVVTILHTGEYRFTNIRWVVVPGYEDTWERAVLTIVDVTAQKQAEIRLSESEQKYRALLDAALRQAQETALMVEVRLALANQLDLKEVFKSIVEAVSRAYGYTLVGLYLLEGDTLVLQHQVGFADVITSIPVSQGITGRTARTGKPVLIQDTENVQEYLKAVPGVKSEVCVPLFDQERVVGVLNAESEGLEPLDDDDLRVMTELSGHLSLAISRARLYTQARENEAKFRSIIENSEDGILLVDEQGILTEWNSRMEEITGLSRDQIVGRQGWEIQNLLQPADLDGASSAQNYWLDPQRVTRLDPSVSIGDPVEMPILRKDGARRYIQVVTTPIRTQNGTMLSCVSRDVTERKQAETLLRRQNEYLNALHETTLGLINRLDLHDLLEAVVQRASELFGSHNGFLYLVDPERGDLEVKVGVGFYKDYIGFRLKPGEGISGKVLITGRPFFVEEYDQWEGRSLKYPRGIFHASLGVPLISGGRVVGVLGISYTEPSVVLDNEQIDGLSRFAQLASIALENARLVSQMQQELKERKRAELALRESEERYALAVRGANEAIWDWDITTNRTYYSPRWREMLGMAEEGLVGDPEEWFQRVHPADLRQLKADIAAHLDGQSEHFQNEHRILHTDGMYRWVLARGLAVRNDRQDGAHRMAGSLADISARKSVEERLRHDAMHDPLTDLPNRMYFMEHLSRVVERARRSKGYLAAVLFMDVDRFKIVNDSLGHASGDLMLKEIALRLEGCMRLGDTIARFGGDEFAMLLDGIGDVQNATRVAERIQGELVVPFNLNGHEVFSSGSIGIALTDNRYKSAEDMLRDADTAMYRAKANGRAGYQIFDLEMHSHSMNLLRLEADLRRAIERQEFRAYYQPIVSLKTGQMITLEALIRWEHPQRGLILPPEFISLAEETGLIVPIGNWILKAACWQARDWIKMGFPELQVAVNISARQLQDPGLPGLIRAVLAETELSPASLHLEITESAAMRDFDLTARTLRELNDMGLRISIDDFGSSYSSLGYLKRFPVSTIKIDHSFIREIPANEGDAEIAAAIVAMGHILGLKVIAEGVETDEQLAFLVKKECDAIQGFRTSRPLPAEEITQLLRGERPLLASPQPADLFPFKKDPKNLS